MTNIVRIINLDDEPPYLDLSGFTGKIRVQVESIDAKIDIEEFLSSAEKIIEKSKIPNKPFNFNREELYER